MDMRPVAPLLLLLLLASSMAIAGAMVRVTPGRGIGPMVLGAKASAVAQAWGAPRQRPAKQGADYRWHEYPERSAWMLVCRGVVVKVGAESNEYATAEGFTVGTTSRAIAQRWGQGSRRRAIPWNEKPDARPDDKESEPHIPPERFFLDYPSRGISFLVDTTLDRVMAMHVYPPGRAAR